MDVPENWLLSSKLRALHARLESVADRVPSANAGPASHSGDAALLWRQAELAVHAAGAGEDAAVALPVLERDLGELAALLTAWAARKTPLPAWDQAVLKRAMNAYKKRLRLARADDAISSSRNPLSRGASSGILGIRPPDQYAQEIWDLLVAHGRLRDAGDGLLEPATDALQE